MSNERKMVKILLLEDNEDMRLLMAKFLTLKLNCRCLNLASVNDLKEHSNEVLDQHIAILDIDLGVAQPSGLDAWQWLKSNDFRGRTIFLTGQAKSNPLVADARRAGAIVIEKPVKPDHLVQVVRELLTIQEATL